MGKKGLIAMIKGLFLALLLGINFVSSHWINLHVWYEEMNDQEPSSTTFVPLFHQNDTNRQQLNRMQQDADASGAVPGNSNAPNALLFHQPRPLPPCDKLPGLTQPQIDICRVFTDHMRSVVQGAKLGLSECRWQFRHHQWNCSSPPGVNEGQQPLTIPNLTNEFQLRQTGLDRLKQSDDRKSKGQGRKRSLGVNVPEVAAEGADSKWNTLLKLSSKEVAFAHSVWSAAVTHAVARSCRDGSLTSCSCGKTPRPSDLKEEWRWGGCGDNLQYAYKFASDFVDSREKEKFSDGKRSAKALVNLHNNEAGRRAVLKKTRIACKCHGVSGSCALVTCWHQVPSFRDIGDNLKERYGGATLVKMNRRGRLQVKRSTDKIPSVHDLVYVENSPNYCVQNQSLGVAGPSGRVCNRTSTGSDSCKSLCCNKGFTTTVNRKSSRCQCKFIWCCQVVCQECKKVEKISTCK